MSVADNIQSYQVKKKYVWRDNLLKWATSFLTVGVVVGTVLWLLFASNFSFNAIFQNVSQRLRPQISTKVEPKSLSKEDELKQLIEKEKLLEISALTKTTEGDFQLTAKNGPVVFFAANKDLADQVATLQTLLTKARIDNKALKKVDFRFEKIVVEY